MNSIILSLVIFPSQNSAGINLHVWASAAAGSNNEGQLRVRALCDLIWNCGLAVFFLNYFIRA